VVSGILILAGKPAIAGNVGVENRGEFSWQSVAIHSEQSGVVLVDEFGYNHGSCIHFPRLPVL
jgi:hypothetical protein